MRTTFIDSFSAVDELRGKALNYENLKEALIRAGRFSVFEATATMKHARLYTQLADDLELEFDKSPGYPWTLVRKRAVPLCAGCRGLGRVERLEYIHKRVAMVHYDPCPVCRSDAEKGK